MKFPSQRQVEKMRMRNPKGTRIELEKMDDVQAPPIGTKGTVLCVDDTGCIFVSWDNGRRLNVIYGEDQVRRIYKKH